MRPQGRATEAVARDSEFADVLRRYRAAAPGAGGDARSVPLAAIIPVLGPLPASTVAALALNVAAQLAQIHANGSLHGELTPWNLMLSEAGPVLARGPGADAADGGSYGALGRIPRALAYLTPEQVLGVPTSAATDVFALGAVLAFAASGRPPFGAGKPEAVLFRIVNEPAALDAVPASVRGLVKACLSQDPQRRPTLRTVGDRALGVLKDALATQLSPIRALDPAPKVAEPVRSALGSVAIPTERIPRRRSRARSAGPKNPGAAMVGTAAVVVIGVIAAFFIHGAANSSAPMLVRPTQAGGGHAPLPGSFLAGPGCPASPWTGVAQAVAATGGLEPNLGGGPADCGGTSIGFLKNGMTAAGSSGYAWTFRLGARAHCGLSLYIGDNEASSGFAHYRLTIPAPTSPASPSASTGGTVFQVNQSAARGQWVTPLELGNLTLYDGSVQLTLTDAGSYPGDRFHVTASAVRAVCTPID